MKKTLGVGFELYTIKRTDNEMLYGLLSIFGLLAVYYVYLIII